jgi:hypothetical protein
LREYQTRSLPKARCVSPPASTASAPEYDSDDSDSVVSDVSDVFRTVPY